MSMLAVQASHVNRLDSFLTVARIKLTLFCNSRLPSVYHISAAHRCLAPLYCAAHRNFTLFRLNSFSGAAFVAALQGHRRSRR